MPYDRKLPNLPDIQLSLLEDISPSAEPGFLQLRRHVVQARYPGGEKSPGFAYDWLPY